jgi:hypothetical protein
MDEIKEILLEIVINVDSIRNPIDVGEKELEFTSITGKKYKLKIEEE